MLTIQLACLIYFWAKIEYLMKHDCFAKYYVQYKETLAKKYLEKLSTDLQLTELKTLQERLH